MPDAPNRAREAVAFARHEVTSGSTEWYRLCLKFVRTCYGIPPKYATAIDAWHGAKHRHDWSGHTNDIPYGAPVWSARPGAGSDDAGHIFIAGGFNHNRDRLFRSTDIAVHGGVSVCRIEDFQQKWGMRILGYADDLNGYNLDLPLSPNRQRDRR